MRKFKRNWENDVVIKNSSIHGKGMFALNDIPEEELVMVIRGEVITGKECVRREEKENNVYIFWNGRYYIDTINTDKIKYINHNCDPNCYVDDRDKETLNLISLREIKKGEELTIDYGYEEIYDACSCETCGSEN